MSTLDTIRHLLPRAYQWNVRLGRGFKQLIDGIVPSLDAARSNADEPFVQLFPQKCDVANLANWERQWALQASSSLTEQERRDRLDGVWSSTGGQSPGYITDTLQAHGFAVFTHEWWDLLPHGYPAAKDPRDHLKPEYGGTDTEGHLLVNRIRTSLKVDEIGAGEAWAEAGEDRALAGYYKEVEVSTLEYVYAGPTSKHAYYLYIGGATFPNTVDIPTARREEFENLCLQICPAQQWLVLRVRYI